ncbi:paf acetylhydrolase [Stagonosporopsis vannaccii]|nr:paf acetylhydrolase [Stagonosporopsis vannaccii]
MASLSLQPVQARDYSTFQPPQQATQRSTYRPQPLTTALNCRFHRRHIAAFAVMTFFVGILIACFSIIALFEPVQAVYIPGPNDAHAYTAAVANFPLTTASRKEIGVSLFMPIAKGECSSDCDKLYMPPDTARDSDAQFFGETSSGVFETMKYKACCSGTKTVDASKIPLVFMEPQVGTSRFLYSTLARFMSANGMAVVLVDHPNDRRNCSASLDPFADLKVWDERVTGNVNSRIEDINTVLHQLGDAAFLQRQFPDFKIHDTFDTNSYSVVGHGIGGSTATTLSVLDPRVRFSINLSGSAPLLKEPTYATIYFFGRSDFRRENDIHWPATWKQLAGRATEWDFKNAGIFDFSDLPWIVDLARNDGKISIEGVKGLRDSLGPFGFHVNACYLEAYLKAELTEPKYGYVGDCYRLFDQMQPYPGGVH